MLQKQYRCKNKVLTISVASFNVASTLKQLLDSIVTSEVLDLIEVLIINDGSEDDSAEIASSYVNAYPNSLRLINKTNGGWGSTVNKGIDEATGKYFRLLDGDDWYDSRELDKLVRFLVSCDADMVITKYRCVYPDYERQIALDYPYDGLTYPIEMRCNEKIAMHSISVKTDVLKSAGVRITEHAYYTDLEYNLKAICSSRSISFFDADVYRYRLGQSGQSVSFSSWIKNIDSACKVTLNCVDYVVSKKNVVPEPVFNLCSGWVSSSAVNKYRHLLCIQPLSVAKNKTIVFDRALNASSPCVRRSALRSYSPARIALWLDGVLYLPVATSIRAYTKLKNSFGCSSIGKAIKRLK